MWTSLATVGPQRTPRARVRATTRTPHSESEKAWHVLSGVVAKHTTSMRAPALAILLCAAALLLPVAAGGSGAAASRARDCGPSGQCDADGLSLGGWGDGGDARWRRLSCSGCPSECSGCTYSTCTGCRSSSSDGSTDPSVGIYIGIAVGASVLCGIIRFCLSRNRSSPISSDEPNDGERHATGMNPVMVAQSQQPHAYPMPYPSAYPGQPVMQAYAYPGLQQHTVSPPTYPPQSAHVGGPQQISVKYGQQ